MDFENVRTSMTASLHETSKSSSGDSYLLSKQEGNIDVCYLDKLKDWFCDSYRNGKKLCSCDAYYNGIHNFLVIEFKNTSHLRIKEFFPELMVKFTDTHFLLAETYYRNRKITKISSDIDLVVVYNDSLYYGKGVRDLEHALTNMQPKRGDTTRKAREPVMYSSEEEYQDDVEMIKGMYEKEFYKTVEFIDKKDFVEQYINTSYFQS